MEACDNGGINVLSGRSPLVTGRMLAGHQRHLATLHSCIVTQYDRPASLRKAGSCTCLRVIKTACLPQRFVAQQLASFSSQTVAKEAVLIRIRLSQSCTPAMLKPEPCNRSLTLKT